MRNQSLFVKKMMALVMALMFLVASSVTRAQAAPAQDLTPEQIEAVIEDAFAGLAAFDAQRVLNNFAADAVLEDPVGTPPMQGTQAIAAYLATFPTLFIQMKLYSLDIKVRRSGSSRYLEVSLYDQDRKCLLPGRYRLSSSSTRMGKFNRSESSLISIIFFRSCEEWIN